MTGTIEDGFHLSEDAAALGPDVELREITAVTALVEQAKGVLIFRYSIGARTAFRLIQRWAEEAGVCIETVARSLVHVICQGDHTEASDPRFVRWLEDRLRSGFPGEPRAVPKAQPPVKVAVDQNDCSLDAVVEAAREASRRRVPLEITADPLSLRGIMRPQIVQRMNLAVELARAVAPGLEVRLPEDDR
jgi:hypothetical protein